MFDDIFKVFSAWEPLAKARKAKGLGNWEKLAKLSDKLTGKTSKDIVFTCGHPSHGASGDTHNLGSVEGTSHFLMGYGNPGFHMAPYHWHIIYPELDEEELTQVANEEGHPSKPMLWDKSGLAIAWEGDTTDGAPHPYAHTVQDRKDRAARSIKVKSKYNTYTVDPAVGMVYEQGTERVYPWSMVKNSYFAYENPEIAKLLEDKEEKAVTKSLPDYTQYAAKPGNWDDDVYPLVKSLFPVPGSVLVLNMGGESVYGSITPDSIVFSDSVGNPLNLQEYDRVCKSLDLRQSGDTHPSALYAFAERYLGIDMGRFLAFSQTQYAVPEETTQATVFGLPSRGYAKVSAEAPKEDQPREVVVKKHAYKAKVTTK
jgi:hypothetical protein